jgi:ribonucleoside-triphosphate reductase
LRSKIVDPEELNHPESMRFCGFANVTINLPQLAYRSKGNWDKFFEKLDGAMTLAMKAHMQRKKFIQSLMVDGGPLWEIGKNSCDGKPYVDLDKATYIIGMVGLNECVQFMSGKQLHESEYAFKLGIKVIASMKIKTDGLTKENKVKVLLEESPAESAASRLAKLDLKNHPEETKNIVKGIEGGNPYYTNSCHFAANAPISMMDRIIGQSKFHPLIESGAITHAFVGEKLPSKDSILNLIEKVYKNTHTSQMTISPEFTVCNACNKTSLGLKEKCASCGSDNVYGITRIVGYFSKIQNWNAGKKMELKDRESAVGSYQSIA